MSEGKEQRAEQRLRYHWPVWFAEDFHGVLSQGQMVDVSSGGAAFTCHTGNNNPHPGQHITTRFSVPCYRVDESFDMTNFTRDGHICRVDKINSFIQKVAVQFSEPLTFKPGEQSSITKQPQQIPGAVVG